MDRTPASSPHEVRLGRNLRARHTTMISVGGIIGAGLFVGSSASIASTGPAVIVSYALAGLLILLVMRIVSEMAVADAIGGSFTELTRRPLGAWAGFISGWLYWYFWVVVVPIEVLAAANIVHAVIPLPIWQIGVALLAGVTTINLVSTRSFGELEFWLSSAKVAGVVAFVAVAGAYAAGLISHTGPTWSNLYSQGGFAPTGVTAIFTGVVSVVFALTGAEITTIAAGESAHPERAVRRITGSLAVRILLFYVVSITLVAAIVPWRSVTPGVSPFATALAIMHIPGAATIMNIVVLAAVTSCLNSALYVTSRVLFGLAAKGDAPQWLVKVNRRGAPARAILFSSLFGYLALFASILSPSAVFSFLVNASGAVMLFIYILLCLAQLRMRARLADPSRLKVRMWLHPWGTYGVIGAIVAVLIAMAATPSLVTQLCSSLVVATLAAGAFLLRQRRRLGSARPRVMRAPLRPARLREHLP